MKRRKSSGGGGANWMDTYGDMVTLLLTLFVMLYAMSSLDQQKWEIFVKSIYPSSSDKQEIAINQPIDEGTYDVNGNIEMEELVDDEMETLYLVLAEQFNSMGIEGVTLSRGEDYTFIAFEDKTFFEGDGSELTEQGGQTLDVFCQAIAPLKDKISQINIMGHTSQGDPERPNTPRTDRMLSSMRAAEVTIYIQESNVIQPEKMISTGFGQFRPVDTFETFEGRAKNRRVEILMIDEGADIKSLNQYYEEYTSGVNADRTVSTDGFKSTESGPEDGMMPQDVEGSGAQEPAAQ